MSIKDEAESGSDLKYSSYPEPQRSLLASGYERGYTDGASRKVAAPADVEWVRGGICLLCGDGVLENGEHIDPERHGAEVEQITSGSAVEITDEMVLRAHEAWQTAPGDVVGLALVRRMLAAALGGGE